VTSNLGLYIAVMTLYQRPHVLGIVVDEVEQAVAVKIWIAHINRHHIRPITRPEAKAITQVHASRAT
jgi:hypothetical protein